MLRLISGLLAVCGSVVAAENGDNRMSIIPQPREIRAAAGSFTIAPSTRIVASGAAALEAAKLRDALAPAMGFRLDVVEGAQTGGGEILLVIDEAARELGKEGYALFVTPARVEIRAPRPAGLFYGIQTLRQLLPPASLQRQKAEGVAWAVPCVTISDAPRFRWRGMLIDTARHFVPREAILRLIDVMALHKMNSLQLHLTDDQGWRIEIKKYPKLTEVGAWRSETVVGHAGKPPLTFDGKRHGGFYTQDDLREIVRYAGERYINVVPEIEMPGHARAAIAAYPQLGCNPEKPLTVWTTWGVCPDILVPTDETVRFMQDVLTEVMDIFPSEFIHIGGDEATKEQWKASPLVQARIRELGLKDEAEMQSWFVRQMDAFLTKHGRRLIGWDEILEGGLAPSATVMSWRGEKGGIAAAQDGHDVVMAPTTHTYLDYYQGPPEKEPLAIGGNLPLEKIYSYEPIPKELTPEQARHVLGAQAQLWAEYIPTQRHLEYMAFPRALALAEVVWSPKEGRSFAEFAQRLDSALRRLDAMGVNYRKP